MNYVKGDDILMNRNYVTARLFKRNEVSDSNDFLNPTEQEDEIFSDPETPEETSLLQRFSNALLRTFRFLDFNRNGRFVPGEPADTNASLFDKKR